MMIFTFKEDIRTLYRDIVVRSVFHEDNKYYPQVFLDESLYKFQI